MTARSVAVAGGSGFIGSQLVRQLVASGYDVRGSFRDDASLGWHVDDLDCSWHRVELDQPHRVAPFIRGAAAVVHCAGYVPPPGVGLRRARQQAVSQLRGLLDTCLSEGVRRVVYVSSISTAMGDDPEVGEIDESARYVSGATESAYFEVKSAMEAEVYRYVAAGLDVVLVMPTMVVGPNDFRSCAGRFVRAVATGGLRLQPEGITVNVVDIRDVAAGILAALERGRRGRRYILGGTNVDLAELIEQIATVAKTPVPSQKIDVHRIAPLLNIAQRFSDRFTTSGIPPLLTAVELARRSGAVSRQRAAGELNAPSRRLETTLRDTVQWFCRIGYLSWSNPRRGWRPPLDLPYSGLDRHRSFC